MKFSLILFIPLIAFLIAVYSGGVLGNTHVSSADLQPEWSSAGQTMNYKVTITNEGPDAIEGVKIYKNENYEDFSCDKIPGWVLTFISPPSQTPFCFYISNSSSILAGENETFTFSAKTSFDPQDVCELTWEFETIDKNWDNRTIYDTTSIDSNAPIISKKVEGTQIGECPPEDDEICWITKDSYIIVSVSDDIHEECNSGIDYCTYTIKLDGELIFNDTLEPDEPELNISWIVNFTEDSEHELEIICEDVAGNKVEEKEIFKVDSTPPTTEKIYGEPFYTGNASEWITTSTPITLSAEDGGEICAKGVDKTWYIDLLVDEEMCSNQESCEPICENPFTCDSEHVCHNTERAIAWCQDKCTADYGNYSSWEECVEECSYYCCDGVSRHRSGGEECGGIGYCNIGCSNEDYNEKWKLYKEPFNIEEKSCHLIQFFSVDELGNYENMNYQCVFVEDEPPVVSISTGEPKIACNEEDNCDYWIQDHVTNITLSCYDPEPHPSGVKSIEYRWKLDGGEWTDWILYKEPITFEEDSVHYLEYRCTDNLGHVKEGLQKIYRVDSTPPEITKTMIGEEHLGECPPKNESSKCYVKGGGGNGIYIEVADPDPTGKNCNIGVDYCNYELWWHTSEQECYDAGYEEYDDKSKRCLVESSNFSDYANITFIEDSTHDLHIYCLDKLGNSLSDTETFLVDSTPPEITKIYGEPYKEQDGEEWITSETEITLNATDEKVGTDKIQYRVSEALPDSVCYSCEEWQESNQNIGDWNDYTKPFTIPDESCHVIEYKSADLLGNEEIKWQCVFVDNSAPKISKIIVGPQEGECPPEDEGDICYIDGETEIYVNASDQEPHPVGGVRCKWKYTLDDEDTIYGPYSKFPINFLEETQHNLVIECGDALGNTAIDEEIFYVDKTPPKITKEYGEPYKEQDGAEWITNETPIIIRVEDDGYHKSGLKETKYRYGIIDDGYCSGELSCENASIEKEWTILNDSAYGKFNIEDGDSCHLVEIYAEDNVGKASTHKQCVFVDNSAPGINKTIIGPHLKTQESEHIYLTKESVIRLECKDVMPHPIGGETLYWEMYWSFDDLENWTLVSSGEEKTGIKEFTDLEESYHKLVYWCEDALGNTGKQETEIDVVDNTPPSPIKSVGEPKIMWDGENSTFYPEIKGRCWSEQEDSIDCWKVTLDTPISLNCIDSEPHPVDNEKVCFKVEVDGEDMTGGENGYCQEYGGVMNEDDGYCCLNKTIENFVFLESTEHNLKFYCVDGLGNTNKKIEEEKFKVEGNNFVIKINKKWNLISIPVVLLNSDIKSIIPDSMGDVIESVWTYDGETDEWFVYTPDGIDNDNLHQLIPGWGYWVLAKNETEIVIGGSLLSPGRTPPSRVLVPGWNLIGYYGMDGQEGYYGPEGNGADAYCALYSLTSGELGMPKWSSLYGYWELNSLEFDGYYPWDSLDPGAGYWINMKDNQQEYIYSPSTFCTSWFDGWFPYP